MQRRIHLCLDRSQRGMLQVLVDIVLKPVHQAISINTRLSIDAHVSINTKYVSHLCLWQSRYAQKFMFVDLSRTAVCLPHSQVLSHVRQHYHKGRRKEKLEGLQALTVASSGPCESKLPLPSHSRRSTPRSNRSFGDDSSIAQPKEMQGAVTGISLLRGRRVPYKAVAKATWTHLVHMRSRLILKSMR